MKISIPAPHPMLYLFPKKHLEDKELSPYLCIIETRNGAIRRFEFRLFFTKRLTTMVITNTSSPLQTTSMRELLENPAERQPVLVEPLFPQCGLGAVIGSSDCGKSTMLRQLAACVAGAYIAEGIYDDQIDRLCNKACFHLFGNAIAGEEEFHPLGFLLGELPCLVLSFEQLAHRTAVVLRGDV